MNPPIYVSVRSFGEYAIKDIEYKDKTVRERYINNKLKDNKTGWSINSQNMLRLGCPKSFLVDWLGCTLEDLEDKRHVPTTSLIRLLSTIEDTAKPEFVSEMTIVHRFFIFSYNTADGTRVSKIFYNEDLEYDFSTEFDIRQYSFSKGKELVNNLYQYYLGNGFNEKSAIEKLSELLYLSTDEVKKYVEEVNKKPKRFDSPGVDFADGYGQV